MVLLLIIIILTTTTTTTTTAARNNDEIRALAQAQDRFMKSVAIHLAHTHTLSLCSRFPNTGQC